MAKSKIISASIAVDIQNLQEVAGAVQGLSSELSNMQVDKNLEPRLKNVERTLAGAVKQINAMTDKIDMLSKIKGIDPKVVHDLSLLSGAIADVKVEVDALSSKFNNFSKGIGDVKDVGIKQVTTAISKEIGDMSENISASIDSATKTIQVGGEKLKKAYEQILNSINAEIDEKGLDISKIFKISDEDDFNDQFKKIKDKLEKDLKSLAEAANNYNNIKISGGGEDELIKAAKAQASALEKLKESFQAFYSIDDLSDHAGEDVTKKMTASINEVIKSFPNLQGEVYRTFDEIYDFIDAITENITNDFTASINTIKSSLKDISEETKEPTKKASTDAKTRAKSVEKSAASEVNANVSIKEGVGAELIAELKTVINDLQKYANTHPVELDAVINPTWGTAQTRKYLKSIKEQLSKTKDGQIDEKLAARIYGLQDAFGADFSEALNKAIQKLKDSVGKEGFSVGKITIDDSAVKELREQISNEIGAITVDINANILGTTVVDKDKTDAINKQYEELRNSESLDPNKVMDLVKAIKESGANLDYSDAYKDRLKQIVKGLVEGIYGSVPEAIRKTRYPEGTDPLKMEFNGNSARIKELVAKVNGGATGDALIYYKDQIEKLLERQRTILANLSQNVAEETPLQVEESIKDATQQINAATIDVATATININNGVINDSENISDNVDHRRETPNDVSGYTKFIDKNTLERNISGAINHINEIKNEDNNIKEEIQKLERAINKIDNIDEIFSSFMAELPYEINYHLTRDKNGGLIYSNGSLSTQMHTGTTSQYPVESAYVVGDIHNHPDPFSYVLPSLGDMLSSFNLVEQKIHSVATELQKGVKSDLFDEFKFYIASSGALSTIDYSELLKMSPEQRNDEYMTRLSKYLATNLFNVMEGGKFGQKLLSDDEETREMFDTLTLLGGYLKDINNGQISTEVYDYENGKWINDSAFDDMFNIPQNVINQLNQLSNIIKSELINESIDTIDEFQKVFKDMFHHDRSDNFYQRVVDQALQRGMVLSASGNADQAATTNAVKEITEKAEATLVATRDELVKAANQKFAEILADERAGNLNLGDIDALVKDLRLAGIDRLSSTKLATTTTTGRIVDAMLKGGYTSALEAFKSTTSHSAESKAKAQNAQLQHTLYEGFMRLYDKITVQEKGTGSIRSIQAFVDKVRKSGYDFKVDTKYQDNEIGKLINTVLTEGYAKVSDAVESKKSNASQEIKSTSQHIENANINISKATINVKNGKGNVGETKGVAKQTTEEDKTSVNKLQKLIEQYNKNISQKDTMSLDQYLKRQEKLLIEIAAIKNSNNDVLSDSESVGEGLRANKEAVKRATEAIDKLLSAEANNSPLGRYKLFNSKKIYQTKDLHELEYALSGDKYQNGYASTLLQRGFTSPAKMNAYTTEKIHNHPSGTLAPSLSDISSWFSDLALKKSMVHSQRDNGVESKYFDKYISSIVALTSEGVGTKMSFDMSKFLSLNNKDRDALKDKLLYGLIATEIGPKTLKANQLSALNYLTDGALSKTRYTSDGKSEKIEVSDLSEKSRNVLDSLIEYLRQNLDLNGIKNARAKGWGEDYKYLNNFKADHIRDLEKIAAGEVPSVASANEYISKLKGEFNLDDSGRGDASKIQKYLDQINNLISSTTDEALQSHLEEIRVELENNYSIVTTPINVSNLDSEAINQAQKDLRSNVVDLANTFTTLKEKTNQVNEYLKDIENINKFVKNKKVDPSKLSSNALAEYDKSFDRLKELQNQLSDAITNNNYSDIDISKVEKEIESLRGSITESIKQTIVSDVDIKGLIRKIDNLQIDEVKTDPAIMSRVKQIRKDLSNALNNSAEEMLTEKYNDLKAEISKLSGTVSKSDRTFFGNFMKEWRHKNFQMLAQFFSFYDIIRYMREAVNVIKQYDNALIEMMKVSDETRSSLEKYQETLFDTADAIGASALTLEQSTADWMRIGESLTEAAKSAKAAQILMNVSEFQDINSATQALVSASQAYAELDKMDIVDKINKLGNEFPIATDQLATALQNSAAALTTQGNDINEALALVVGGNIITQDALKTGTGIRTIALRIAGTKEAKDELAELGEGVDDFVVRTESKTRKLIMDYTAVASNGFKGIDVYNENGNLRSTYEILQDIADIYKEIQLEDRQAGTNRANALVELLAGKNRSNIAASILTNPDTIREAYEAAQNAEGSAVRENEKYLTSVEAHMTQFKNAVDQLINDLVDSGFVNKIIDFGTKFINVLDEIINRVGGVGAAITALAAIIGGHEGFFGAFIKNIPILIKGIKQFSSSGLKLTEIMQLLGTTFETASGEAVAFSSALLTTGIGALVVTLGVIISYVSKLANGIKEARKAVRDYAKEVKDLNESLDDYAKKIANARTVLENEYSTTEEIINAKNELNNIQNELNETYGNYNNILKDVNATIEQQNALLIQSALDKNREVIRMAQETSVDTNDLSDLWLFSGLSPSVPWLAQTGVEAYAGNEYDAALKFLNERTRFKSDDFTDRFSNMDEIYKLRRELIEDVFISGPDGGLYINDNLDKRDVLKRMQEAERALENIDTSAAKELLDDIKEYETALSEGIEQYSDIMDAIGQDMASTKYADDYNNAMEKYFEHLQKGTDESRQELIDAVDKLWQDAANESDNASKYWINSFFKDYTDNIKDAAFEESWKSMQSGTTYALGSERNSMSTLSTYSGWLKNQGVASDELLRYLQGYGNVTLSDEQKEYANVIREIFTQYGIDYIKGIAQLVEDELLYDTNTVDFNKQLQEERDKAVNSGFISAEEFDKLNISTSKELDIWRGIYKEANNAAEAVKMYGIATSGLGRATGASDILRDMQSQYKPVFDAMAEAYRAIWTNGKFNGTEDVTTAQIESVRSQIESLNSTLREAGAEGFSTEEVDAFILTLADAGAEEEEVQNAFNSMATTLVDSLNPALGQASGETAGLIQKTLTELGVVNAEEVVFSRLGFTLEEYAAAKEVADENELDLDKEISALTDEELELIATNEALSTFYENRILYNSLNLETAEDISRLTDLCDMLDRTAIGLLKVGEMKSRLSSIEMLRSQGRDAMADFELEKLKKEIAEQAQYKPAEVKVDGNKNTSSTSGGGSPSPQDFDWIERVIKKIQRAVTNFGKIADATYKKWGERIGGITKKYENLQEEILIQQQAEQAYMAEANAIGLSETYASKVRDGLMDIETITDDALKEQIQKYQEYYDKATDAADAVEDLRAELAQLAQTKFDNITKQFEEMALAIDHTATRIGHIQSKMDAKGYFESSTLIEQLIIGDEDKLKQLEQKAAALAKSIDEAVTNGDIEYGSEQWWGMWDSLQSVNDEIVEMSSSLADLNDQLRQMNWDNFDYISDAVNRLVDENEFLIEVLQDEEQMFEKNAYIGEDMYANGNMSDAALAVQGLHVNNLKILQEQNKKYAKEVENINRELANDPNNKKLLERRNELIDQQQDIIKGISDEKHAIKDLIQEGYETFLDYLQKSIDKRKEILEAQKSLYDYEKNIKEQTKAIASYQKQLAALGGDTSEENQAHLQELADSLNKAEEDLQESEYERWLSDQEEMMDNMYSDFEKLINDKLDNVDELITRAIDQTAQSAADISRTIQDEADEFLYNLDNTSFGVNMDMRMSDAVSAVHSVEDAINTMINAANINAQNELVQLQSLAQTIATQAAAKAVQTPQVNPNTNNNGGGGGGGNGQGGNKNNGGGGGENPNAAAISKLEKEINSLKGEKTSLEQIVKYYTQMADNAQNAANRATDTTSRYQQLNNRSMYMTQVNEANAKIKTINSNIETKNQELQKLKNAAYAKGGVIGNAIKRTGEDGIILARSGEEVLSIERVKQMQQVFKLMQPLSNVNSAAGMGGNTTVNGMNVVFDLPNVTSYEDFVNKAQKDPRFERLVQSVTIGNSLGKSKLSKYSI